MARVSGQSTSYVLDFEAPIAEIEGEIEALELQRDASVDAPGSSSTTAPITAPITPRARPVDDSEDPRSHAERLAALREARDRLLTTTYRSLTPWQTVKVARHPLRPQSADYVRLMCRDFAELHGDRRCGDDAAIVTGLARIASTKVMLIGHRKGRSTAEKLACPVGCAHPEGYRKALLKMRFAEKFRLPIVTLVDTPGAFPGIGSEQRGIGEAIAVNLREMSRLRTPIISIVIGEGGSGGALGIAIGDRVAMLEHAWYSVISPEGCAAILWKQANDTTNNQAARALALTAADNLRHGLIDDVIPEPAGGAHRDPQAMSDRLAAWINDALRDLQRMAPETLVRRRYEKFRRIGRFGD